MFVFYNFNDIFDLCFDLININIFIILIDCMFLKVNFIFESRFRILVYVLDCVYV